LCQIDFDLSYQDTSLLQENTSLLSSPPNIIGATGGSGTRVIARIVRRGGMFIGENLSATVSITRSNAPALSRFGSMARFRLPTNA
jgi:hypothetical protein